MKRNTALAFLACAAALAAGATDVNIEGRWLVDGVAQSNLTSTCAIRLYGAADAVSPLAETNGARFATDATGHFAVCAEVAAPAALPDTFWVGVAPAGRAEIAPRFRVSPVPFALAADEAELVTSDKAFTLAGAATIENLAAGGNLVTKTLAIAQGANVATKNLQLDNVRLSKVTLATAGMLGFFDCGGATPTFDFDSFSAEKSVSASTTIQLAGLTPSLNGEYAVGTGVSSGNWTFDSDGFLLVALKADPKQCPPPLVTVTVGTEHILSKREFGAQNGGAVKRFMTIPYRAGEEVSVTVEARGLAEHVTMPMFNVSEMSGYAASAGAKVRLVRFGRD